jgi:hypothetical protein
MGIDLPHSSDSAEPAHLAAPPTPIPPAAQAPSGAEAAAELHPGHPVQPRSTANGVALDEAAKQEFLWHAHGYVNEYVRFGDTKAAFAGTLASGMLAALYAAKAHIPVLSMPYAQWTTGTWLAVAASILLAVSIILALWKVRPRLLSSQTKGYIYWGSIAAHGKVDLLQTSFHSQSARTLNDHLLHHLFDLSHRVCEPKYRTVSLCIMTLGLGAFLAAASLLLQDAPRPGSSSTASQPLTVPAPSAQSPKTPRSGGTATQP